MAVVKFPGKGLTIDPGQVGMFGAVGVGVTPAGGTLLHTYTTGADVNARFERFGGSAAQRGKVLVQHGQLGFTGGTGADTLIDADWGIGIRVNGATALFTAVAVSPSGAVYIGDLLNAFNLGGLTINQLANDDEVESWKSSDVAHGITGVTETDTFGYAKKMSATAGGLQLVGLGESTEGIRVSGMVTATDTARSTSAVGVIDLLAQLKSGSSVGSVGANQNMVVVRDNGTTRFILDSDGDSHQDVGTAWTNYDTHDDVALLNLLSAHVTRKNDPLRKNFAAFLKQNRKELERIKLVTFNRNGHHFVNMSRLTMLLTGAVRQLGARLERIEQSRKLLPA